MIEIAGITITPKFIWVVYIIVPLVLTITVGYFWFLRRKIKL